MSPVLAAGGRLVHILTQGVNDPQVKCEAFSDVEGFLWRPPGATYATSSLGRKLGIGPRNYWFKTGLDAIKLHPEHTMTVLQGHGVGQVLIRDEDDQAQVEISGCVICNPDQEQSENFDVRVANPGLRPFGTFSSRNMIAAWILCIVLQFMLFRWSIHFEQHHSGWVDMLPWWRYVRLCAAGLKIVPTFGMFYAQSLWCKPKLSCLESALTMFSAVGVASVLWFWSDGKLALFPTYLAGYTGTFLGVAGCAVCSTLARPEERSQLRRGGNGSLECCGRGSSLRLGFLAGWSLLVLCCTAGGQLDLCSCGLPSASHVAGRDGRRGRPSKTLLWPTLAPTLWGVCGRSWRPVWYGCPHVHPSCACNCRGHALGCNVCRGCDLSELLVVGICCEYITAKSECSIGLEPLLGF